LSSAATRHALLLAFLVMLAVGAVAPPYGPTLDVVGDGDTAGAVLEPIAPRLRALLEPFWGGVHLLSGLPDTRLLSWLLWVPGSILIVRLFLRWRRGELPGALPREAALFVGAFPVLALAPLPFAWVGLLTHQIRDLLTPVGLPLAVYIVGSLIRRRVLNPLRFMGILGSSLAVLYAVANLAHAIPGTFDTGYRIVAPDDVYVVDIHSHSATSGDAILGGPGRVDLFHAHGVDISAVTEHNHFDRPSMTVESTYFTQRDYVAEQGYEMLLLPGEEFTTRHCHLTLLGIKRQFRHEDYRIPNTRRSSPPDYGYDVGRLIADVHEDGGYVLVPHWWSLRQWHRVDWERLIAMGVDGFEVTNGPGRASPELIAGWRDAGMLLFAATDAHGFRKSLYSWNLIDRGIVNPDGRPLTSLDPRAVLDRIFETRRVRAVGTALYDPRVPALLDPPVTLWRYFATLALPNRLSWAGFALLIAWVARSRAMRRGVSP